MNKQITISFYDACLPDYFGGHHKPVLQVPVDGITTRRQVYDWLLSELNMGVIDYQIDENRLDYDAIRQAIKECIFWNDNCKDGDILFPDLDKWEESDDNCESVYAFFIVGWEETDT